VVLGLPAPVDRDDLLEPCASRGVDLGLERLAGVRGWGLLQGLVLQLEGPTAPELVAEAMAHRLLLVPAGPAVVRFVPPLVIKPRQLRLAVRRFEAALTNLVAIRAAAAPVDQALAKETA
jgi:adenosylmethionine-8-amino-7-oxononanoate aminotransferase